jgi:ribonucleoside-diphosphate reductase beta chain
MEKRKLYDLSAPNKATAIINGSCSNVLNWDDVQFDWAYPKYKRMLGNFWTPFELNMSNDKKQWVSELDETEKDSFLHIIGLLAMLDSIQTDYAGKVADYLTDSSLNALMIILAQQEVIHNHSYSYVLSSLVSRADQEKVFDYWRTNEVLKERNGFVAGGYVDFTENPTPKNMLKSLVYDVILEGLFFYASFAFFYDLARQGKMMASSQMINYINRDEQLHVDLFAKIFKEILKLHPELDTEETKQFVMDTFEEAVRLEIKWADFIIGNKFENINSEELGEYIQFIANKRIRELGYEEKLFPEARNTMRWIKFYEDIDESKQDFFEGRNRQYVKVNNQDNGFDAL